MGRTVLKLLLSVRHWLQTLLLLPATTRQVSGHQPSVAWAQSVPSEMPGQVLLASACLQTSVCLTKGYSSVPREETVHQFQRRQPSGSKGAVPRPGGDGKFPASGRHHEMEEDGGK